MFIEPVENSRSAEQRAFKKKGLKNVNMSAFSHRNLIIGKNGSGKTRFLKVLEQEKKHKTQKETVITLYFPEIHAFYNSEQSNYQEDAVCPYDLLLEHAESSFYDFLKVMENDKAVFLEDILAVLFMKSTRKKTEAKKVIDELNSLLTEFIGKKIQIDQNEKQIVIAKMEHGSVERLLPFKDALIEFSPGELLLFYLSVFLMIIKQNHPEGIVLIIDEPELHLHPHALVKMIQTLKESENVVELWIASHSLFLVPLFEFEEIIFIDQSTVYSRNSKMYKELFDSLVGLENINQFEFLKSLDNWQYYQFIVECFCLPKAVDKADAKDEQFCKLLDSLRDRMGDKPIQMLDYGAGKCRIWKCMQLLPETDSIKSRLIYTAYEPYPEGNLVGEFKLYTDFSDIRKEKQQFQAVVLMNVLHEIEITQWKKTFQNIKSVLADDGILILIEVLSLTKGEQPYGNNGYLVLRDEQVKLLFDDIDIESYGVDPKEKSNCWVLTKAQVGNVTQETIQKSLYSLAESSYKDLKKEYHKRIDYARGTADDQHKQIAARNYAFLSQQYINAILARTALMNGGMEATSLEIPGFLRAK